MIFPVLMCGGSGTRLWPLSRKSYPKQFTRLLGDQSLFQASAARFQGTGFADPILVTGEAFRFIVTEQMADIGMQAAQTIIEPDGRNTAPAALIAALMIADIDPEGTILLVPSDHMIPDDAAFRDSVLTAKAAVDEGQIVTFGIRPTRPETGFGYLQSGSETNPGVLELLSFIEKPDRDRAAELIADLRFLWNAGVFLARVDVVIAAFQRHAVDVYDAVTAAKDTARADLSFTRVDADVWSKVPDISIDFAVMEKAKNVRVVPFDGKWNDLGSWEAVWQESPKDAAGNAVAENTTTFACEDTLLRSETPDIEIVGFGLKNVVAVAMRDAVMVADMSDAQNVKMAVETLKAKEAPQATQLPVDYRPWGWFETLIVGERFQVKRIHVHPGASLSLQSHHNRAEHWIVVQGTAKVTLDDTERLVTENQSVYIPLGSVHRLENPGKVPMVLIEVQTGSYFGEDDIVRYKDAYART